MAVVNLNAIVKMIEDEGTAYGVAAVSEGFCPVHKVRLASDQAPEGNDEPLLIPSAAGRCPECPAWWTAGATEEKGDWLSVQDIYLDAIRRLTWNPPEGDEYPDD